MRITKALVAATAAFVLLPAGSAFAWPAPQPGQPVCIPNGDGTFTPGIAGTTSPPGSHQPENGLCEGPIKPPPAPVEVAPAPAPAPPVPTPTPTPTPPAPAPTPEAPRQDIGTPEHVVGTCEKNCDQPRRQSRVRGVVSEGAPTPDAAPVSKPVRAQAAELPFTGFDSGIIALLGATSLAAGVVLRRRCR
jgi:hypothetical protein